VRLIANTRNLHARAASARQAVAGELESLGVVGGIVIGSVEAKRVR
jgi:hypothetical protein